MNIIKGSVSAILIWAWVFCPEGLHAKGICSETGIYLTLQYRTPSLHEKENFVLKQEVHHWETDKTAIIICDMWDRHWCKGATDRVAEMAPVMNEVIKMARAQGVLIVHAPSDCMVAYKDHPGRKLAQKYDSQKASRLISGDVLEDEKNITWPIDQADGGCACTPHCKHGSPWRRQIDMLDIVDGDVISDSGSEIAGLFWDRGIKNVILMGVHTNMCVIGRSFGLRNMLRLQFNVALMRDLTDTMYNPESWPYVSHFSGTNLIVEHIEKFVCPTLLSADFTGKKQFRFSGDERPLIAFVAAEGEYRSDACLPEFAHELLLKQGLNCEFAMGEGQRDGPGRHNIENLQILEDADLAVLAIRRRALPAEKMLMIRNYINKGMPILGIRTASHAFDARKNVPFSESGLPEKQGDNEKMLSQWPDFDRQILGGNYQGHYRVVQEGHQVAIVTGMEQHPILKGFPEAGYFSPSWLYKNRPLQSDQVSVLLVGTIPDKAPEPVLWTNDTGRNKVVYSSMGHWDDWKIEAFRKLMTNSILYLLNTPGSKSEMR